MRKPDLRRSVAERGDEAMLKMVKLDIAGLAAAG